MPSTKTVRYQTLTDLALQLYGNEDAVSELMRDNDLLGNMAQPAVLQGEIDIAYAVKADIGISYDTASPLYNKTIVQGLNGATVATGNRPYRVFAKQFSKKFA